MRKSMLINMIVAVLLPTMPCLAEETEELGGEWVVSFRQQSKNGIWDGRKVKKIESIEKEFDELLALQDRYRLDTDIYMLDGHYYDYNCLSKALPKLIAKCVELIKKTNEYKSKTVGYKFSGTIFQHSSSTVLLISRSSGGYPVALELPGDHDLLSKVDGHSFSIYAVEVGTYSYITVSGANRTIKKYKELSSEDLQRLEEEKESLAQQIDELSAALPPQIDFENYLWHVYCGGIESDLEKGLITPDSNCTCCRGKGRKKCRVCTGKGKVDFYSDPVDVIDVRSKTRRAYRKKELDEARLSRRIDKRSSRRKRRDRSESTDMAGVPQGGRRTPVFSRARRQQRNTAISEISERANRRKGLHKDLKRINRAIDCAVCKSRGWIACVECVLINEPAYASSAKTQYQARFVKKTKQRQALQK